MEQIAAAIRTNKDSFRILVVEDEKYVRSVIAKRLGAYGRVDEAGNSEEALHLLGTKKYNLACIDLNLSENTDAREGLDLIKKSAALGIRSVALTAQNDKVNIELAHSNGAERYFDKAHFYNGFDEAFDAYMLSFKLDGLEEFFKKTYITQDESLIRSLTQIVPLFAGGLPLLITGPTGAGKSLLGELLHKFVGGDEKKFVHVNSKEIQDTLAESRLFGHKKGSFTDAKEDQGGFFKKADGGTIFFDEIGNIPLSLQKTLLQVLQKHEFIPVGSTEPLKSNFRFISATNADLESLINQELFREDFYFRINSAKLHIPSLADRRGDIPLLFEHFLSKSPRKISIKSKAMQKLIAYDWPGNARELENFTRVLLSGPVGVVYQEDLPDYIIQNRPQKKSQAERFFSKAMQKIVEEQGLISLLQIVEEEAFKAQMKKDPHITSVIKSLRISPTRTYNIKKRLEEKLESKNEILE